MIELPGYQLLRELGRGGMARVYLALHEGLDRHVAIKLMYPNLSADPAFSARFLREARIVARLNHPNIITIFDVDVHMGYHYIAMEYLPGDSLGDKIKAGIELSKAISVLKKLSMGLKFSHDKGFVHRDIKPENILFREDGTPVITDFGVARAERSDTRMTEVGTVIGTPRYMSPEQAQGLEISSNSDIYSLGIVFYEMLTGEVPYEADSTVAIMYKHVNDPIPELPKKLRILQPLLDKLLAKKANDRYQSAADIITDIERIELHITPDLATVIKPPKDSSKAHANDRTRVFSKKKRAFRMLFQHKYTLAVAAIILVSTVSAILFVLFPETDRQISKDEKSRQDKQVVYQKQKEEEQLRQESITQEAMEREKAEHARLAAENERLAHERAAAEREKAGRDRLAAEKERLARATHEETNKKRNLENNIRLLLATAEASLQKNKLKDAHASYKQVLDIDANNNLATTGISRVADLYLGLALKKAEVSDFDLADAYVRSVAEISPSHPKLATTRQEIANLKNRQLVKKTGQPDETRNADPASQKESDETPDKKIPKQRTFGGF